MKGMGPEPKGRQWRLRSIFAFTELPSSALTIISFLVNIPVADVTISRCTTATL